MKKAFRILSFVFFFCCFGIMALIVFGYSHIPNEISLQEFDNMSSGNTFVCRELDNVLANATVTDGEKYETSVMLFNLFPVKNTKVAITERKYVVAGGGIFGIRLYTKGVMVVKIESVQTPDGSVNPGAKAGLKQGDMILSVDGKNITDNASLSKYIASSEGKTLKLSVERESKEIQISFTPVKGTDSHYKGGLWIRDSSAGIGTMTYYDRMSGVFAGLGHAICDVDTGETMPLSGGDAVNAVIKGCYKGSNGKPGELCGVFSGDTLGELYVNGETGIFGVLNHYRKTENAIPVAMPSEVMEGKAQIISTVDESGPKYYDIEIIKIYKNDSEQRNMIIRVIDNDLISKTGGIVQGMSGSPIIQNGMLVGAVTHVFVDNAKEGYGIFAE
ncbi:MAG: SpoIVB peptidase, partial [Clostridia bacterium]|nr:SpoIVB peptidase [Clostridia bacterium]